MPRVQLAPLIPHVQASVSQIISLNAWSNSMQLLIPAFGLALVASAESLLTARAIDVLVSQRHGHLKTHLEQELLAQGSGNLISGLLGGVPITGVMVRSAANFNAGANSRLSTMLHGVCIAVAVVGMPRLLETIPLAVLASVLVLTGWKLMNLRSLIAAMKYHPKETYLWPLTLAAILATDLLKGFSFAIGVWLIAVAIKRRNFRPSAVPAPAEERSA
jgi:MFS superfamily sulfate permease-like transporter